jgi:hypothetical protein
MRYGLSIQANLWLEVTYFDKDHLVGLDGHRLSGRHGFTATTPGTVWAIITHGNCTACVLTGKCCQHADSSQYLLVLTRVACQCSVSPTFAHGSFNAPPCELVCTPGCVRCSGPFYTEKTARPATEALCACVSPPRLL